jgi:hypothetical protein
MGVSDELDRGGSVRAASHHAEVPWSGENESLGSAHQLLPVQQYSKGSYALAA